MFMWFRGFSVQILKIGIIQKLMHYFKSSLLIVRSKKNIIVSVCFHLENLLDLSTAFTK